MVNLRPVRDRTNPCLEREPVCIDGLPVAVKAGVAAATGVLIRPNTEYPEPAVVLIDDTG
jgi:hypothetical protein